LKDELSRLKAKIKINEADLLKKDRQIDGLQSMPKSLTKIESHN